MPFGADDPGPVSPRRAVARGGRAWLFFVAAGAAAAAGLLAAGKPAEAAFAAGLLAWMALVTRLAPRWSARAVTRTGDGVEIRQRRADRVAAVALGFAPVVGGALLLAPGLGRPAAVAPLAAFAVFAACAAIFGGERLRVGASGLQRVSWSGRTSALQWSALERFEREAPAAEGAQGGGFLLEGPGLADGRPGRVRIRISDSSPGTAEFAAIALARAPERLAGSQPELRRALEGLARESQGGAPAMVRR